jgi:hypothetical protein
MERSDTTTLGTLVALLTLATFGLTAERYLLGAFQSLVLWWMIFYFIYPYFT